MYITELFEAQDPSSILVIYPGRFQPWHKGHKAVYEQLTRIYGRDNVFIATSNKVDPPRSPFSFGEKTQFMQLTGIPMDRVVETRDPYRALEIVQSYDPKTTRVIFAVSEKDMAEDPRFKFGYKKDGSPTYLQAMPKNPSDMQPFENHSYVMTVPTFQFTVLGKPMRSATEVRQQFAESDDETQRIIIKDLFGSYTPEIHSLMKQKITLNENYEYRPPGAGTGQTQAVLNKIQQSDPNRNKFIWKKPNQISGSFKEQELLDRGFKKSQFNSWGGTQAMWDRLMTKESSDPWGPQGNFAGDNPTNVGGVSMKNLQVGDTVKYFGQTAKVLAMSKDRKYSRINILSDFGGTTKDVLTSDLKQLGQGVAEGPRSDDEYGPKAREEWLKQQAHEKEYNKKPVVSAGAKIKIPTEDGITMQDIRLMAGEGKLTKKTVLQAIAVIRKQRGQQGMAEAFGPLPRDSQQIRLGRHTVDIERVGKDRNYIGFAWHDSKGQDHYEEVSVGDLGSYDDLIDRIKQEISYQERQYTDQGVVEGSVDQLHTQGADYSKHSTAELKMMLRPGILHRNEARFKSLIRKELQKREQQGVAEAATDDPRFQKMMGNIQQSTPNPVDGYVAVSYASERPSKKIKGVTYNGKPMPNTVDPEELMGSKIKFTPDQIEEQLMKIGRKYGWDRIDPGHGQGYDELYFDTSAEYTSATQRQLAVNIVKTVNEINKFFTGMNSSLQATGLPGYKVSVWQGMGENGDINQHEDLSHITNIAKGQTAKPDAGPAIGKMILKHLPSYEAENDELGYDPQDFQAARNIANIYITKGERAGLQAQGDSEVSEMIDELLSDAGASGLRTIWDLKEQGVAEDAAGVGVIAKNKKMARDPRYSMSITKDVQPGQDKKNLQAWHLIKK